MVGETSGCSQRCEPEAQVIADLLTMLCQQSVQEANGEVDHFDARRCGDLIAIQPTGELLD